jgi:hypothetical protein
MNRHFFESMAPSDADRTPPVSLFSRSLPKSFEDMPVGGVAVGV